MRKITFGLFGLLLLSLVALAIGPSVAAQGQSFPKTIPLPNGFQPEGVAVGRGPVIFAGSLADGDIYRANLRAGAGLRRGRRLYAVNARFGTPPTPGTPYEIVQVRR